MTAGNPPSREHHGLENEADNTVVAEQAEVAAHALALQKAREIVGDHVERNGAFTDQEIAQARRAWQGLAEWARL